MHTIQLRKLMCEILGLLNKDIDLDKRIMVIRQGVKEINKRNGTEKLKGITVKIGKTKSATSKRRIPLNNTAIEMIKELRKEAYFGEDSPRKWNKEI